MSMVFYHQAKNKKNIAKIIILNLINALCFNTDYLTNPQLKMTQTFAI